MTDNTEETFVAFWRALDEDYAYFDEKNLDWDSIYRVYYPQAQQSKYNEELHRIFEEIVLQFKDRNIAIFTTSNMLFDQIRWYEDSRADTLYANNHRLDIDFDLKYYQFIDNQIYFRCWQDTIKKYAFTELFSPESFLYYKDSISYENGIIIDIRNNYENNENILSIASLFFENELIAYYESVRTGKGRNAWSEKTPKMLLGQGKISANIPVVVLTSPRTASMANCLVNVMKQLPNCRIIGEQGIDVLRTEKYESIILPNYWQLLYPVFSSKKYDENGNCLDIIGVKPDIFVEMRNFYRYENMKDSMVLKAIEVLDSINGF
jgi:hypothetical protein